MDFDYFEARDVFGSGDWTVMRVAERFSVRATGKTVEQESIIMHRWRDEKIVEYREYNDTAAFAEAYTPS